MFRKFLLAAAVVTVPGCGDDIFDRIAFAPAQKISAGDDHCDYFGGTQHTCESADSREIFFPSLDPQVELQALFFPRPGSDKLIVYFHGNGGHVYRRISHLLEMAKLANVLILSYRGYGKSGGAPSEAGVYHDARAALRHAREVLHFAPRKTYLYGRSLGAAVAIEAAQDDRFAGLIAVSPFLSGRAMAALRGLEWVPGLGHPFDSVNKLAQITAPALFIHGTHDRVVPFEQGRELYRHFPGNKAWRQVDGAGHNDLVDKTGGAFWQWLEEFIRSETSVME